MAASTRSSAPSAPAARRGGRRGRDPRLILGIGLLLASVLVGMLVVSRADRTVAVWSTTRDLAVGTVVGSGDVRAVQVQLNEASADYVVAGSPVEGSRLVRTLSAGELVPIAAMTPSGASSTPTRLVTVPVEQFHAPAGLARGELVDVYVTPKAEVGRSGPSTLVAQRATVHAVEQEGGRFGASARSVGVVLSLDPELVSRVVSGVRRGSVDLVRVPLDAR